MQPTASIRSKYCKVECLFSHPRTIFRLQQILSLYCRYQFLNLTFADKPDEMKLGSITNFALLLALSLNAPLPSKKKIKDISGANKYERSRS